jgi:flagellar biosynthesis/type III secretory pathway protein FliH
MVLRLEVFESEAPVGMAQAETVVLDTGALEDAKLASFESGYSAGWEDAAAAQSDDQARVSADLARSLQTLSFTYHEARGHVLKALEPLLRQVVGQLLPIVAKETLQAKVLEVLLPMAEDLAQAPITLVLNPAARPAIEEMLAKANGLPLTLLEEPTLGEGQVYLRLGDVEREVNLDRAVAEISAAVRGFFELPGKD